MPIRDIILNLNSAVERVSGRVDIQSGAAFNLETAIGSA